MVRDLSMLARFCDFADQWFSDAVREVVRVSPGVAHRAVCVRGCRTSGAMGTRGHRALPRHPLWTHGMFDSRRFIQQSIKMAEIIEAPPWQAVGLLVDQTHRDFLARRHSLAEDVAAWFKAVDLFRTTQDERMILRDPMSEDLRQHRTWLAGLIAEGERFLTEALALGKQAEAAVPFKVSDMEATLELLYLWQREWHSPQMPASRRKEIFKAVFNVEEPST